MPAECSFWADFEFYEYTYYLENDTDHTLIFSITESQTIFHPENRLTSDYVPSGMVRTISYLKVYPENVFGTDTVTITITTSDDPDLVIKECQFTHNRVAATGVVLVLDKSGSMSEQGKMQAVKTAAGAFIDSINPSTYTSLGYQNNRYGVVLFNQAASILDIYPVVPGIVDFEIPGEWLNPYVVTSLNAVQPNGYTSIGDGLQVARTIIEDQAVNMRRIILLLSDGKENRTPWISSEVDNLIANVIKVYSIGFGYDYHIDSQKLQDLSNATTGTYRHIDDPDDLTKYFMEVLAEAFDMSVLVDPKGIVSDGVIQKHEVSVTAMENEVILVLSWRDPEKDVKFRVITPSGEISPSNIPAGGQYIDRGQAYKIFKIPVAHATGAGIAPGIWSVEIYAEDEVSEHYTLGAFAKSAVKLITYLPVKNICTGESMLIGAKLLAGGKPAGDANIEVAVSMPAENYNDRIARAATNVRKLSAIKTGDSRWTMKDRKGQMVYKGTPLKRRNSRLILKQGTKNSKGEAGYGAVVRKLKYPGNYDLTFKITWKTPEGERLIKECNRTMFVNTKPCVDTSDIKTELIETGISATYQKVRIYFTPKDINGSYLGLGFKDDMELIGPVSNDKGFVDLGNGCYRIETLIAPGAGDIFLRFKHNIWRVHINTHKQ